MASTVAGEASRPAAITAGSPGIMWTIENTSTEIAARTGRSRASAVPDRRRACRIGRQEPPTVARSKVTTPSACGLRFSTSARAATL